MKFKILITIFVTLFITTGCTSKKNPYERPLDALQEQSLIQTVKTNIEVNNKIKVFITGTYLNEVWKKALPYEEILLGLYVPSDENQSIYNDLNISIEDRTIEAIKLKNNDKLLKNISYANPWAKFYLLKTQIKEGKNIVVNISLDKNASTTLTFTKEIY